MSQQYQTDYDRRRFLKTVAAAGVVAAGAGLGVTAMPGMAHAAEIELPPLPFAENALEPVISARTMSFHYGKHHAGYVSKANAGLENSPLKGKPFEDIIKATADDPDLQGLFNNVAQVWNHTFFWHSIAPGSGEPSGALLEKINADFGSVDACKQALAETAGNRFASGWAWLVLDGGTLKAINTMNADTPIAHGMTPLLTIDVWEHAYYLDYQNRRGDFVTGVLDKLINWDFAAKNLEQA